MASKGGPPSSQGPRVVQPPSGTSSKTGASSVVNNRHSSRGVPSALQPTTLPKKQEESKVPTSKIPSSSNRGPIVSN